MLKNNLKMSNLQAKAKKHLDELSEQQRTSIRTQIGNRAAMYPFITGNGFIYFLQNGHLVCVSLQEENGVYHFWFNGRIIEFDSISGNCFIVDFDKNCLEYFCVYDFFQNATMNARYSFLYRLLIKERVDRISRRNILSLRIFFIMSEVIGQIERVGNSFLKTHLGCLSIHEMVRGMKEFIRKRFLTCFVRSPPSIFRTSLLANNVPPQIPSVDGRYGIGLFLNLTFRRPSLAFGMISKLMLKFVGKQRMTGVFLNRIANGFFRKMSDSISLNVSRKFIKNPNGFKQASGLMDKLLKSCSKRTNLLSPGLPENISQCVSDMIEMNECRVQFLDERHAKQRRIEQEKFQEELQKKRLSQEFQGGIAMMKDDVSQIKKRICILDKIASDEIEIDEMQKRRREFEDISSCLKFEKFEFYASSTLLTS